jgi:hypothetical protein
MALLGHISNKSRLSAAGYIGILEDKGNSVMRYRTVQSIFLPEAETVKRDRRKAYAFDLISRSVRAYPIIYLHKESPSSRSSCVVYDFLYLLSRSIKMRGIKIDARVSESIVRGQRPSPSIWLALYLISCSERAIE